MQLETRRQYVIRPIVIQGVEYDGVYVSDQGEIFPGTYMPEAPTVNGGTVEYVHINPGFVTVVAEELEIVRRIAWQTEKEVING